MNNHGPRIIVLALAALFRLPLASSFLGLIVDWLFFPETGYNAVFARTLTAKIGLGVFFGVALAAFVIFEAAYFGEIVRAGIQSVPRGQAEAATATGLVRAKVMRYVILPQALRNMIPALVTQSIVLLKDTSLASIIGYVDLTKAAQIVNNREIRPFELYLFIAVIYWLCSYGMSRYAGRIERRLAVNPAQALKL